MIRKFIVQTNKAVSQGADVKREQRIVLWVFLGYFSLEDFERNSCFAKQKLKEFLYIR